MFRDVNVRKLCCDCGHVFTLRRTKRVGIKSWKSEMQALRAMEMVCDVSNRRINHKNRVAAKRANETQRARDRADSRMSDRKSKMAKHAEESEQQRADRRMSNMNQHSHNYIPVSDCFNHKVQK